jgi:hypothetical protein
VAKGPQNFSIGLGKFKENRQEPSSVLVASCTPFCNGQEESHIVDEDVASLDEDKLSHNPSISLPHLAIEMEAAPIQFMHELKHNTWLPRLD